MKSMDRIEPGKDESMVGGLGMVPQKQTSFTSNSHARQGKKVESSASHMLNV